MSYVADDETNKTLEILNWYIERRDKEFKYDKRISTQWYILNNAMKEKFDFIFYNNSGLDEALELLILMRWQDMLIEIYENPKYAIPT